MGDVGLYTFESDQPEAAVAIFTVTADNVKVQFAPPNVSEDDARTMAEWNKTFTDHWGPGGPVAGEYAGFVRLYRHGRAWTSVSGGKDLTEEQMAEYNKRAIETVEGMYDEIFPEDAQGIKEWVAEASSIPDMDKYLNEVKDVAETSTETTADKLLEALLGEAVKLLQSTGRVNTCIGWQLPKKGALLHPFGMPVAKYRFCREISAAAKRLGAEGILTIEDGWRLDKDNNRTGIETVIAMHVNSDGSCYTAAQDYRRRKHPLVEQDIIELLPSEDPGDSCRKQGMFPAWGTYLVN